MLGERVKCVISVSMLSKGWNSNTVTHVLGVRTRGTHLPCEQVVGRGLRRMSNATNPKGHFSRECVETSWRTLFLHPVQRRNHRSQTRLAGQSRPRCGRPQQLRDHLPLTNLAQEFQSRLQNPARHSFGCVATFKKREESHSSTGHRLMQPLRTAC